MAGFPLERPVYLLGESFGGILALAAAAARPDLVDRVILANPATSYPQSVWPTLGPLLPRVPKVGRPALTPPSVPRIGGRGWGGGAGTTPYASLSKACLERAGQSSSAAAQHRRSMPLIPPVRSRLHKCSVLHGNSRCMDRRACQAGMLVVAGGYLEKSV